MNGIIVTITRLTKRFTEVTFMLALSNRLSSNSCMLKVRITIMPERFSRVTGLRRSIRLWMISKRGSAITINRRYGFKYFVSQSMGLEISRYKDLFFSCACGIGQQG